MILLSGHELTPARKLRPEALTVTLKERDATATVTPDDMTGIDTDSWILSDDGPGEGTVWRVRSISQAYATNTPQVQLEHAIMTLRDRIIFGEIKAKDITGNPGDTTCTAEEAIEYILGLQEDWVLDESTFGYGSVSNPYKFDGDNLYEALEKVSASLENAWWSYDMTVYPFKLTIAPKDTTHVCELRPGRNLRTISQTIDRTGMFTRFYPVGKDDLHISGNPYRSKNTATYGVIEHIETDESLDTQAELIAWADEQLNRHAEPLVNITAEGLAIAEATGEPLDRLTLGWMCRIPLNEYSTTITERIIEMTWPDAAHQPENVRITLSNKQTDVTKIIADVIRTAGRRGRATARKDKEDHAWFEDTTEHVSMVAEGIVGTDAQGNPNWTLLSEIIVDGTGVHQTVSSVQNDLLLTQAQVILERDQAGLLLERYDTREILAYNTFADFPATGNSNKIYLDVSTQTYFEWDNGAYTQTTSGSRVKRGGIIAAINEDDTVTTNILGDKIIIGELDDQDLDSWAATAKNGTGVFAKFLTVRSLTAQEITTMLANIGDAAIDDLHVGNIDAEIITCSDGLTADSAMIAELNGCNADYYIVDAVVSGNTLTLTKANGDVVTFSKAAAGNKVTGTWSGATLSVSPSATGLDAYASTISIGFQHVSNPDQYYIIARRQDNDDQQPTDINATSTQYKIGTLSASPNTVRILNGAGTAAIANTATAYLQDKTGSNKITANGTYSPASGYIGFGSVQVDVQGGGTPILSGTWSGGTLTVRSTPAAQDNYVRMLVAKAATWATESDGKKFYGSVPIYAQYGSSGQYEESTGWSAYVDAREIWNAGGNWSYISTYSVVAKSGISDSNITDLPFSLTNVYRVRARYRDASDTNQNATHFSQATRYYRPTVAASDILWDKWDETDSPSPNHWKITSGSGASANLACSFWIKVGSASKKFSIGGTLSTAYRSGYSTGVTDGKASMSYTMSFYDTGRIGSDQISGILQGYDSKLISGVPNSANQTYRYIRFTVGGKKKCFYFA